MSNPLYDIQDVIRKHLSSRRLMLSPDIKWISRREGKLLNDIDAGRSTNLGLACHVYPPIPLGIKKNVPGPQFQKAQIRVTWFEDFDLNQTGKGSDELALNTLQYLHHAVIPDALENFGLDAIACQEDEPMVWSLTKQGLDQWDCFFEARIGLPCLRD